MGSISRSSLLLPPNRQPPAQALDFDSLPQLARAVGSLLAAGRGFLDGLFDRLTSFAGALLDAANTSSCLPSLFTVVV